MRTRLFVLLWLSIGIGAAGCQGNSGGGGIVGDLCINTGWVCSTAACQMFPTNPGCIVTLPVGGYCPLQYNRCWDPTKVADFCDPAMGVCASLTTPEPAGCPPLATCSLDEVKRCYTIPQETTLFCNGQEGLRCRPITCGDGGATDMPSAGG